MLTFEVFYDSKSFVHIKAFKNSSCKFVTVFFLCEPVDSRCFQIRMLPVIVFISLIFYRFIAITMNTILICGLLFPSRSFAHLHVF